MRIGEYALGGLEADQAAPHTIAISSRDQPAPQRAAFDSFQMEIDALLRLGIGKPIIARAAIAARNNGTTIERELLASGTVDPDSYYAGLARALKLSFLPTIDASLIADSKTLDTQLIDARMVRLNHVSGAVLAIVPEISKLDEIAALIGDHPTLLEQTVVTTPSALRQAVWRCGAERRVKESARHLFDTRAGFSARIVLSGKQGFLAGLGFCAAAAAFASGVATGLIVHLTVSMIYMGAILLRALALGHTRKSAAVPQTTERLPVYTVLVALYKEAEVAGQLVAALKRLNWPAAKLDIKLICEADDHPTIAALRAEELGPQFEIVEVPAMQPRTKPKALNYALAAVRGEFLVIYDAEDRPHPDQLRAAYAEFAASPADVVCLQAPLVTTNGSASWIAASFALEYAALFRMLLPMLASYRLPMPLGGTSNHLRVAELKAAGGWDPHNFTEDADLGMRLYRLGYRCGVIDCPTYEDAPTTAKVWLNQRTRWFKGWLQTWLVMMRSPLVLLKEMGPRAFAVFQLLIGGMLVSSLAHPWLIVLLMTTATYVLLGFPPPGSTEQILFMLDIANTIMSYSLFYLLGRRAMLRDERQQIGRRWLAVPVYWLMISLAAWRAALELPFKPFFWSKTPHLPTVTKGKLHPTRFHSAKSGNA